MLNKHNLNIAKIASKDESRYTLNAIQVTHADTRVTDGHVALVVTRPSVNFDAFPIIEGVEPENGADPFLLDTKTALEVSKAIPNGSTLPILHNALVGAKTAGGKRLIATTDCDTSRVFQCKEVAGSYPNMDFVFAPPTKADGAPLPGTSVYLNADLLVSLLNQLSAMGKGKSPAILLTVYDANNVVRLDAETEEGQQVSAVVMPMSACDPKKEFIKPRVFGKPEPVKV